MFIITSSSLLFVLSLLTQTTAHRNLPRQPHQHQHQIRHHELEERLPITGTTTVVVQMTQTTTVWVKPTDQVAFGNGGSSVSASEAGEGGGSSSSNLLAGASSSTLAADSFASSIASSPVSNTRTSSLSSSSAVYSSSSTLSSTTSLGVNNVASPSSSSHAANSTSNSNSVISSSTISNPVTSTTLGVESVGSSSRVPASPSSSIPSKSSSSSLTSTSKSSSSTAASLTVAGVLSSSSASGSTSKSSIITESSSPASTQTLSSSTTSHFSSTTSALTVDRVSSSSFLSTKSANATSASVQPSTSSASVSKDVSSSATSTSKSVSSSSSSIKTLWSSSSTPSASASASKNDTTTSVHASSSSILSSASASKNVSTTSISPSPTSSSATITSSASHIVTSSTTKPATSTTGIAISSSSASKDATTTTISSSTSQSSTTSTSTTSSASATSTLEPLGSTLMNAYYPDWSGWYLTPEDVDWSKYDVIDFAFAIPTSDYNLEFTQDDSADLLNRLVATGHAAGKRVKLSIGGWTGSKFFSTICASSSNRKTFIANILAAYNLYNVDGIDIDWEYPGTTGADGNAVSSSDSANFLKFLTELRAALPTGALISTATQVWPFADSNGSPMADVSGFAAVIDWILIMNYDVWGSSTTPGANAPLSDGCGNSSQPLANAYAAVSSWTNAGMPANQITLGVPAYGYLQKSTATSLKDRRSYPTLPHKKAGLSRSSSTVTVYNGNGGSSDGQVMFESLISQGALTLSGGSYVGAGGFTREWDSCSSTPFLRSSASGQIVTYDDPQSMSLKGQFAAQAGLRGCNVFSIDGDWTGSSWPLTDSVRSGLGL